MSDIPFKMSIIAICLVVAVCCCIAAARRQDRDKDIKALWSKYEDAEASDEPKTALTYLEHIKSLAKENHLPWDYYDACRKVYSTELRTNWKLRDSLLARLDSEVGLYADPMVTVFHRLYNPAGRGRGFSASQLLDFVIKNEAQLRQSNTPEFVSGAQANVKIQPLINESAFFKNDYQNALWLISVTTQDKAASALLQKEFAQVYPQSAWLEYYALSTESYEVSEARRDALKLFENKYSGKAVALLASEDLLQIRMDELESEGKGSSQGYLKLRDDCKALVAYQKSFTGEEAKLASCCKYAGRILEQLEDTEADASVSDGVISLRTRNLKSIDLSLKALKTKKEVWSETVVNKEDSFYKQDTTLVSIPDMDDGDYVLYWSGKGIDQESIDYSKYSISVACRIYDGKYEIFAADSRTGKPLGSVSGFELNGFTEVPENIAAKLSSRKYEPVSFTSVSPSGKVMKSREISRSNFRNPVKPSSEYSSVSAVILTDCAAFHPADTVKFKLIAYKVNVKEDGSSEMSVFKAGETVKVSLMDSEGNNAGELSLNTNGFGSSAGEFIIPSDRRYGQYRLTASVGKNIVGSAGIVVGEYVLPTFEIIEDKSVSDVYPGDTIRFSGKVKSYSGRLVSSAASRYQVTGPDGYSDSGMLKIESDGSYCIPVPSAKQGYYSYELSVSDATGETVRQNGGCGVIDAPGLSIDARNTAEGICAISGARDYYERYVRMVSGDELALKFVHENYDGVPTPAAVEYKVTGPDGVVASGSAHSNQDIHLTMPGSASGLFTVDAEASVVSTSGKTLKSIKQSVEVLIVRKSADSISSEIDHFIMAGDNPLEAYIGTTEGDIWAMVNLASSEGRILKEELIHITGKKDLKGSIQKLAYRYDKSWSGAVTMNVVWFKDNESVTWSHTFSEPSAQYVLPLEMARFVDETAPGRKTEISFRTAETSELAVTVYDKAAESIRSLYWPSVHRNGPRPVNVYISTVCGSNDSRSPYRILDMANGRMSKSAVVQEEAMVLNDMVTAEDMTDNLSETGDVRDDFKDVIAFEPALYPDVNGIVSFAFLPSDKLSTYVVKAYAHDVEMNTAQTEREIKVTLPVELSVQQPQFLYVGDKYLLRCSVSDTAGAGVEGGEVTLTVFDGKDRKSLPLMRVSENVVFINGIAACDFEISSVPECNAGELGLMVTYSGSDAAGNAISDGVLVAVPVYKTAKLMTETHSAVFKPGMDKTALIEQIRSAFTNLDPESAKVSERTIGDLLSEVLDIKASPMNDDAISLMNALTVRLLSAELNSLSADVDDLEERIAECRNSDGGYGWRSGMESSQLTTAYMLASMAMLRDRGILPDTMKDVGKSVKYIDNEWFGAKKYWYALSLEQYCSIRSLFPDVSFDATLSKDMKKALKEYLTARDEKEMKGNIMGKLRRIMTIDRISSDPSLAVAWGVNVSHKLMSTRDMDMKSIRQYAVEHSSGGLYYPNAVMPFRGLLESEIYAHTLLCNLFAREDESFADGLRLWLLLQKETQEWNSDPASVLAVAAIMDGPEELKKTSIVSLSSSAEQRFDEIKAASNGFSVGCRYYVESSSDPEMSDRWVELKDGDIVDAGRRVMAKYEITSAENRSFVMIDTPRPACLLPENQISGRYGWRVYRDVRLDGTQWWMDVFPEEKTTYTETFIASQCGVFQRPAATVTCLYAPHWSANTTSGQFSVSK